VAKGCTRDLFDLWWVRWYRRPEHYGGALEDSEARENLPGEGGMRDLRQAGQMSERSNQNYYPYDHHLRWSDEDRLVDRRETDAEMLSSARFEILVACAHRRHHATLPFPCRDQQEKPPGVEFWGTSCHCRLERVYRSASVTLACIQSSRLGLGESV
jgi:hypothetical protein